MLHLIYQCEDTVRSKLSENNFETCRDFSFVGPGTMRNYLLYTMRNAVYGVISIVLIVPRSIHLQTLPFLHGIRPRELERTRDHIVSASEKLKKSIGRLGVVASRVARSYID